MNRPSFVSWWLLADSLALKPVIRSSIDDRNRCHDCSLNDNLSDDIWSIVISLHMSKFLRKSFTIVVGCVVAFLRTVFNQIVGKLPAEEEKFKIFPPFRFFLPDWQKIQFMSSMTSMPLWDRFGRQQAAEPTQPGVGWGAVGREGSQNLTDKKVTSRLLC